MKIKSDLSEKFLGNNLRFQLSTWPLPFICTGTMCAAGVFDSFIYFPTLFCIHAVSWSQLSNRCTLNSILSDFSTTLPITHTYTFSGTVELSRSVTFWSCERHPCSLWQNKFKSGQMEFVSLSFFGCFSSFLPHSSPLFFDLFVYACGRLCLLAWRQKYQKFPF